MHLQVLLHTMHVQAADPLVSRVNRDKHFYFYVRLIAVAKTQRHGSRKILGLSRTMDSEMEMPSLSRTRASLKGKSSQGETATIWAQDDVREFERIATQQNAIESEVQKQDYPESEMDEWDWDEMEASPFKETTTAIKRPVMIDFAFITS